MKKSYSAALHRNMSGFLIFTITIVACIWLFHDYNLFKQDIKLLRKNDLQSRKEIIVDQVNRAVEYVEFQRSQEEKRLRKELKQKVEEVHGSASFLYHANRKRKTLPQIRQMIYDMLHSIKWNNGRGYYFAIDTTGITWVHPKDPPGTYTLELQDPHGKYLVKDFIRIVTQKGEGFSSYTWEKPPGSGIYSPKISYVKLFKPLNVLIGSGEYLDDVQVDTQELIKERLSNIRFLNGEGYIFIVNYMGNTLVNKIRPDLIDQNVWDLKDQNGKKIIQELIHAAKDKDGGFVGYTWNKPGSIGLSRKVSFARGIRDWKWCIGAGIYLDEIEKIVSVKEAKLRKDLIWKFIITISILAGILAAAQLLSRQITRRAKKDFLIFSSFFTSAASDAKKIDLGRLQFDEFNELAISANRMVDEQHKIKKNLKFHQDHLEEQITKRTRALEKSNLSLKQEIKVREHAEKINRTLFEISNAVNTTLNLEDVYKSIHQSLGRIIDVTNCYICIHDKKNDSLTFPLYRDVTGDRFEEITNLSRLDSLTLSYEVIKSGKPLLISKKEIEDWLKRENKETFGTIAEIWMGVPLKIKNDVIGLMAVQSYSDPDLYNENDVSIINFVSDQVAIAIERKQEEKERIRLITAIEQAAEAFIITDVNGIIEYVNPAFKRITEYSRKKAVGRNLNFLKSSGSADIFDKEIPETVKNGDIWTGKLSYLNKSDEICRAEMTISPIRDSNGNIVNIVAVARDVTREDELEAQLQQAQKMESIGTLAGGIAHDFNNILSAIMGYTETAMMHIRDNKNAKDRLEKSLRACDRAKDLISQILSFSRIAENIQQPVKISPIIKETLKLLRASLPTTIEIKKVIRTDFDTVNTDPTQIHQVLMNLCTNALHAMKNKDGILTVTLESTFVDSEKAAHLDIDTGSYLKLLVEDTGSGIEPEILNRIFDPYFTTKEKGEGTGLGLAVVHGIVSNHGGTVCVESEPGTGTAFHIYLPRVAEAAATIKFETVETLPAGNERILLVDDEKTLVEIFAEMLSNLGYKTVCKTDSQEALEFFREKPDSIDIVITDLTMPKLTGDELAKEMLKLRPNIPIILCTGYGKNISSKTAASMGFRGFILKPVIMRDLAAILRKLLD